MAKPSKKEETVTALPKREVVIKNRVKVTGIPFLKIETHVPALVRMTTVITAGLMKKKPANFVNVDNLETGESMKLLLGTVLCRQILENYPNESYVGKCFEIIKGEKVKGNENEYHEYELNEIEIKLD